MITQLYIDFLRQHSSQPVPHQQDEFVEKPKNGSTVPSAISGFQPILTPVDKVDNRPNRLALPLGSVVWQRKTARNNNVIGIDVDGDEEHMIDV